MKRLLSLMLGLILALGVVSCGASAETTYRYVNTANHGSLNLREDATTSSEIMTTIPYGTKVKLIDYTLRSAWANVTYNGYWGYVQVRFLSVNKPSNKPVPTATPHPSNTSIYTGFNPAGYVALVTPRTPTGFVHLRWAPSKSEPIFRDYYASTELVVLYENNSWCMVYDEVNHLTGYMMKEFLNYAGPWEGSIGDGVGEESEAS